MRLSSKEIEKIKSSVSKNISEYELYLFGSRVDDSKKGGDIDLLILTDSKLILEEKWQIRRDICKSLGEQKIDIINFTFDSNDNFKDLILTEAVKI